MKLKNPGLPLLIFLLLIFAVGFLYFQSPQTGAVANAGTPGNTLLDLKQFDKLRKTFENDSGHVRLVALLSPV